MAPTLWHIDVSPFSEKVRWAFDYKGVAHELRAPMPVLHRIRALALTRGSHSRLPIAQFNGRPIGDSTAIIAELERLNPDPPLYPRDAEQRERALELEDYFDTELAPQMRLLLWHHTIDNTDATIDAVLQNSGSVKRGLMRATAPLGRIVVRRDYGANAAAASRAPGRLRAVMDRIEQELGSAGYLVGDSLTVADISAAALFTPLLDPPGRPHMPPAITPALLPLREELSARKGGTWINETYTRHRGVSAAV
jgi:glutathione S-transferase